MTSRRQARQARERARFRAARLHPAAAARYNYRRQLRRMTSVGIWLVRRGASVVEVLGAWVLSVMAKFGGISLPPAPRPSRPTLAELAAAAAKRAAALAAIVAAGTRDHLALSHMRTAAEIRTESLTGTAVSPPGTAVSLPGIPARTYAGHAM